MTDKPINVLLIEDNPGDARLIEVMLSEVRGAQFDSECVDRLSTGLERLAAGGIDVVLLDLGLPDSSGLDTFIRLHAQSPEVPIIVLSGLDDEALAVDAVGRGAQDYLVKGQADSNLLGRAMHYAIERKKSEDALRESEEKYRSLIDDVLDTSDVGIFIIDPEFKVVWINHSTEKYFGLIREDVIGKDKRQLIHNRIKDIFEDPETFKQKVFATYDNNTYIETFECHVLPGEERKEYWLEHWSQPIRSGLYKGGRIEHYTDITERKQAEDQQKASLKEKEVLLREIHHRVKNNLQVVSSLLNMQARAAKDKNTIDILSESRNRINTIALIHSQLYESENVSAINMKGFMDKLLLQMLQIHSVPDRKISPVVHVVECSLPISTAVPVGLITNELLTNAFKHAFVNRKEGKIEVSLGASGNGKIDLTVSDDGIGLPEGFEINTSKTLGLHVVKILAEDQLDGNLEVVSDKGTTFKVEFEMAEEG